MKIYFNPLTKYLFISCNGVSILILSLYLHQIQNPHTHKHPELKQLGPKMSSKTFPPGFYIGCASSAYQVEGAWNIDGEFILDSHVIFGISILRAGGSTNLQDDPGTSTICFVVKGAEGRKFWEKKGKYTGRGRHRNYFWRILVGCGILYGKPPFLKYGLGLEA